MLWANLSTTCHVFTFERSGVRLSAQPTVWRGEADMQRLCCSWRRIRMRLGWICFLSREADEHLSDASREDGRPAPAMTLSEGRWRYVGVGKERGWNRHQISPRFAGERQEFWSLDEISGRRKDLGLRSGTGFIAGSKMETADTSSFLAAGFGSTKAFRALRPSYDQPAWCRSFPDWFGACLNVNIKEDRAQCGTVSAIGLHACAYTINEAKSFWEQRLAVVLPHRLQAPQNPTSQHQRTTIIPTTSIESTCASRTSTPLHSEIDSRGNPALGRKLLGSLRSRDNGSAADASERIL